MDKQYINSEIGLIILTILIDLLNGWFQTSISGYVRRGVTIFGIRALLNGPLNYAFAVIS